MLNILIGLICFAGTFVYLVAYSQHWHGTTFAEVFQSIIASPKKGLIFIIPFFAAIFISVVGQHALSASAWGLVFLPMLIAYLIWFIVLIVVNRELNS